MGKTSTERSRIHRQKLKKNAELYNIYKSKDRDRKRSERSKPMSLSPSEIERRKKLNRERVKKFKLRKKMAKESAKKESDFDIETIYKTPQALGKAVNKVRCNLPKSPRKRKAVVSKLVKETPGIHLSNKKKKIRSKGNKSLSQETIKKVDSFFKLDSISRQSPGKKDFITRKINGKKQYLQKRHLLCSLRETHALFLKEHPEVKIGFTKFCSLRPANVLFSSDITQNVCLCQYHENIRLLCDCLAKVVPTFPSYSGDFVDNAVCDSESEECMMGKCSSCPTWLEDVIEECDSKLLESKIKWYQWERVEVIIPEEKQRRVKVTKKMKKICKEGSVREALGSLQQKLPSFLEHVFVKRQQSSYFEEKLKNLKKDEAVIQVDFSENYSCQFQDEIQAAHWNQDQITLFPVAVWTIDCNGEKICDSHVIVSDDLGHNKQSVAVFMSIVIDKFVKEIHDDVKSVFVFSDGPSSQFKNRYIVNFLHTLNAKVNIQWNYFATSHGKGAVDGIGGTVKRMVWNAVKTRRATEVTNAKTFCDEANKLESAITAHFVSKQEITKLADFLNLHTCFSKAPPLPGISRFHCIKPEDGYAKCKIYSNQNTSNTRMQPEVFPYDSDESEQSSDGIYDDTKEEDNSETDEESSDQKDVSSDSDDPDKDTNQETNVHSPTANKIQGGFSHELCKSFNQLTTLRMPYYMTTQVDAIVSGLITFCGSNLINENDIQGLIGNHQIAQDNWLSNFVIDNYLELVKLQCADKGIKVQTIKFEIFEKGSIPFIVKKIDSCKLLEQDLILVPCNPTGSDHWFLLAVLPKKKFVLALDSLVAENILKPSVESRMEKMATVLAVYDPTLQLDDWKFFYNIESDLPQQDNNYDCGVYTCMFAKCLAGLGSVVDSGSLGEVRKQILLSLHRRCLMEVPEYVVALEQYYAVHYEKKYYIGRALSTSATNLVEVKFLHNAGADKFNWPKRDDIDKVHISSIFYGPVVLGQSGPFTKQDKIDKIFNTIH